MAISPYRPGVSAGLPGTLPKAESCRRNDYPPRKHELRIVISVVIPTLNAQEWLPSCLAALVPAVVDGLVREVIISDGGSNDLTCRIADETGARFVSVRQRGRGMQLKAGAAAATSDWLLFLHADTVLEDGWQREVERFINRAGKRGAKGAEAAVFRFALDDRAARARFLEKLVAVRARLFHLPYGDQGLLIPKQLYEAIGGYQDLPLMEDVDLVRRLNRGQLTILSARAVTSAIRFRQDGYVSRSTRNLTCLLLYYLGVPADVILRVYERRRRDQENQ